MTQMKKIKTDKKAIKYPFLNLRHLRLSAVNPLWRCNHMRKSRVCLSAVLIAAMWLTPITATAQLQVAVSSITGGSSVFVFRSQPRQKRFTASAKPARSKDARIASVKKIRKQFETIAKVTPRREKAKVVDPFNLPPDPKRTMPAAQVSVLFAGVGEFYLQKGDFERSFEFFEEAIKLDGKNDKAKTGFSEALAAKGNDLLVKDQPNEAKAVFLEALTYDTKNAAAYFGLGEVFAALDQNADAIANFEKALATDKELTEIYVPLGIIYFQSGEIAKADELLTKALASSSDSAETQFFLGMVRASQNRLEEALAAFQKAKTLDPTYAEAFYNSAETLIKLKRPAEAIPDYQKAVALKADYFDAQLGLAEAQAEMKDYVGALPNFQAASKLKNDNWQALAGWGDAFLQTGKFLEGVGKLNLAATFLTRTKDYDKTVAADIYSKIGFAYGQDCEERMAKAIGGCSWTMAIKSLEKAIELTSDPIDYANLGWAYLSASRSDLSLRMIPQQQEKLQLAKAALLKVNSTDKVVMDSAKQNLGAVFVDLGDFQGAVDALKDVAEAHPEWSFSGYALGTAYFKLNDFDNAARALRKIVDRGPDPYYLPALKNLGATEIRRKNGKEVKRIIELLKKVSPGDALAMERDMKAAKL